MTCLKIMLVRHFNEPGFRENSVRMFLMLLAVSIRTSENPPESDPSATVRDDLTFRVRESPALGHLTVLERQDLDEMRDFLEIALESGDLRIADETPEGSSH